jgi:3-oxoadipate enol-lactonase
MDNVGSDDAPVLGTRLAFERRGSGPDLVWSHGLAATRASENRLGLVDWHRVPTTVLRYDAPGHGTSGAAAHVATNSWENLAAHQLGLADAVGIDTYIAAGMSMGAGTAIHAAVLAPARIRALVLVTPPTAWETRATQAAQWSLAADLIEQTGVDTFVQMRATQPPPDPFADSDRWCDQVEAATREWDPRRLAAVLRDARTADLPPRAQVAAIRVPTLILAWTGDAVHPVSAAEELAATLPSATMRVASTATDVAAWSDAIAAFVADAP